MDKSCKLIVTSDNNIIKTVLIRDNKAERIFLSHISDYSIGDIYLGRVQKVKKDLNAVFVELSPGIVGFLPLQETKYELIANRINADCIKENDIIPVMISKEASKTKPMSLTCNLSVSGQYSAIHNDGNTLTISSKLSGDIKKQLYDEYKDYIWDTTLGIILRTNAKDGVKENIASEITDSLLTLKNILDVFRSRTVYSCLYKSAPAYIDQIRSIDINLYSQIITDNMNLRDEICKYIKFDNIMLYNDKSLSLKALYSLDKHISDATSSKVNLKSGGYLIIQPTEALTVIDVNSGKASSKNKDEIISLINSEAAAEIGRQLILRNISGIIIVDFINYTDKNKEEELVNEFRKILKQDPLSAKLVDITALGLIEITRKKKYSSIYDNLKEIKNF